MGHYHPRALNLAELGVRIHPRVLILGEEFWVFHLPDIVVQRPGAH